MESLNAIRHEGKMVKKSGLLWKIFKFNWKKKEMLSLGWVMLCCCLAFDYLLQPLINCTRMHILISVVMGRSINNTAADECCLLVLHNAAVPCAEDLFACWLINSVKLISLQIATCNLKNKKWQLGRFFFVLVQNRTRDPDRLTLHIATLP